VEQNKKQNRAANLAGQAAKLVDLADYQEGAVVSRVIMKSKAGTVTLFAFDAGQGLSEHTAPFDALVNVLEGEAQITISGNAQRVRAGEMVIMPAQHPHDLHALTRFKMMLVMIRESA
jgi:quercetin dioxygenase-like cupin family protein